jgi:hypothetical protein
LGKLLRRLSTAGDRIQSITRSDDGFVVTEAGSRSSILLSEIVAVHGTKVDKITYEEIFLVVMKGDGSGISIRELAVGFSEFEQVITASLSGFPTDWRMAVERKSEGEYVTLWTSSSS